MSTRTRSRRLALIVGVVAVAGALVAACGSGSTDSSGMSGMDHTTTSPSSSMPGHDGMPGMDDMPTGDGLAAESSGFRFAATTTALPGGQATSFTFRITDTSGKPVTAFEPDQTKLMHFYLIRSDLTGFQHIHPTMAADGTWSAPVAAAEPGTYRAYASFITKDVSGKAVPLVLSQQVTVAGTAATTPLPPASTTTKVDGYTVTLASDQLMAGMSHDLTVTVSQGGRPVTDLQPYLDTYAHLTAFHDGDLAFAHLHPHGTVDGGQGGPALTFEAMLPKTGQWRLFLQFQTGGALHAAAVTITVA
ncbi:MAG TPA: hypothetical protein VJ870_19355 [Amycolatopsis sp.]|nr:hypothetical protein [Amycolatopsis sp.]